MVTDLTVDFAERRVTPTGLSVRLTEMEYRILARVWGLVHGGGSRPLGIIKSLRGKLGARRQIPLRQLRRIPDALASVHRLSAIAVSAHRGRESRTVDNLSNRIALTGAPPTMPSQVSQAVRTSAHSAKIHP